MSNSEELNKKKEYYFSITQIKRDSKALEKKTLQKPLFYLAIHICKWLAPLLLSGYNVEEQLKRTKGFLDKFLACLISLFCWKCFCLSNWEWCSLLTMCVSVCCIFRHTHTYRVLMHMCFFPIVTVLQKFAILRVEFNGSKELIFTMSFTSEGIDYIYCINRYTGILYGR